MAEQGTRHKALGASVILALSLHALAFWGVDALTSAQRASGSRAAVHSVQLRLLHDELAHTGRRNAATVDLIERGSPLDPVRQTTAERATMSPTGKGESQTEARADSPSLDESGLVIEHPDSPLPGGHAKAQVTMILNRRGQVDAIELDPGALPDAFIEAIRSAFVGRMAGDGLGLGLGLGLQSKQGARLCVEVEFLESEPPRWRIQGPPSGPKLPC